jgi:hypothetical protein
MFQDSVSSLPPSIHQLLVSERKKLSKVTFTFGQSFGTKKNRNNLNKERYPRNIHLL